LFEKLKRSYLGDLDVNGRIILKRKRFQCANIWTGFSYLTTGSGGGLLRKRE
jgi:hypothetical protein